VSKAAKERQREFVAQFEVPPTTGVAYRFGRSSAYAGYERLSFAEFFTNAPPRKPADMPLPSSLYRAYKRGYLAGKEARALRPPQKVEVSGGWLRRWWRRLRCKHEWVPVGFADWQCSTCGAPR
jgi:hypothetical protein